MPAYKNAIRGDDKKEEAKEALGKTPVLVIYVMDGCKHCENTEKAWEKVKEETGLPAVEIEASASPDESVTGFPTIKYKGENGEETSTTGEKSSADEILSELKVPKKSTGGRRRRLRSRRHINRRGGRKSRHRTLRSYIAFRK